jgi:hypothetical protein
VAWLAVAPAPSVRALCSAPAQTSSPSKPAFRPLSLAGVDGASLPFHAGRHPRCLAIPVNAEERGV